MEHQLRTTANFGCSNRFLTWYVCGLNHQVEHHLFPQISSRHYPALRQIVKEVCQQRQLPYHEYPTFRSAILSHLRHLRNLGRAPVEVSERAVA